MPRLIFNRFHFTTSNKIENKTEFIKQGLSSKAATSKFEYAYKIIGVSEVGDFLQGYLIKYDPYSVDEVFDEKTGNLLEDGLKNKIVAKSLFLMNLSESLIIFEQIPNLISKKTFISRFSELFRNNFGEDIFVEIHISAIKERYSFINQVRKMSSIYKLKIDLVPSNPRYNKIWERTDKRLRENNITSYKEVQESKFFGGLTIDEETESKLLMTEDGYGDSVARGKDENGEYIEVRTQNKDQDVSVNVPIDVFNMGIATVIRFIEKIIDKIKERTDNNE